MENNSSVFVYSPELEKISYPHGHPFDTSRARQTMDRARSMGLLDGSCFVVEPQPAPRAVLERFHTPEYLDTLERCSQGRWNIEALHMGIGTSDCPVFEGIYEHSALATGATLTAVQYLLDRSAKVAFSPSGGFHHAFPNRAAGFCYINDVGLACDLFAAEGKRVLYLDVDVHAGDGVAHAFRDRRDVMTISLHQDPGTLFPGSCFVHEMGRGEGKGYCINIPLPMGTYDEAYLNTFREIVLPLIKAFDPDVFVFEFGADALASDPLAQLQLTNNTYATVINHLLDFNKPILMTGGGGYHVENTVRAWLLGWSVLTGQDYDANICLGGVMMETTEWSGGLRDRDLIIDAQQKAGISGNLSKTIDYLKTNIFPLHGI